MPRWTHSALVVSFASIPLLLAEIPAWALGPLSFSAGVVRLTDGAKAAKSRSLFLRGQSLVLAFPTAPSAGQSIKPADPAIREIRLTARGGHGELELRFAERAETLLGRLHIRESGADLLLSLEPSTGTPAPEPKSPPRAPAAAEPHVAPTPKPHAVAAAVKPTPASPTPPIEPPKANLRGGGQRWNSGALSAGKGGSSTSSVWLLMTVVVSAAAFYYWYTRRRKKGPGTEDLQIDVVASRALSGKQRLVLVEAGGELMLLGCSDRDVRLLRTVDRARAQRQRDQNEQDFFAEGHRMDFENALRAETELAAAPLAPVGPV